jgi:glycine betaine/proline transport system substrate-binding protein
MTKRHRTFPMRLGVAMTALAMVATACGGSDSGSEGDKSITMGVIPGWTDETATTGLLKDILEDNGYTVEVTELSDNAPMYTALSNGDIDILSSAWPELTHKSYMDRFGDDIEDIGVYYEGATSFLAVPEYSDLQSIEDLPGRADEFGGKIIGIEPGAGLTKMTQESVIPAYGLDSEYELVLSSTAAMLTELQKATEAEEPIVVTLWKPFWANLAFPVRALEDPKGAYGEPEDLHVLAPLAKASPRTTRRSPRCCRTSRSTTSSSAPWRTWWSTTSARARSSRPPRRGSRRTPSTPKSSRRT